MIVRVDSTTPDVLPTLKEIQTAAAVIFEDADFLISANQPKHLQQLVQLVRICINQAIPTLGIGFCARLIAYTEGGEIQHTLSKVENGEIEIYRLHLAGEDPWLHLLPETFFATCNKQDDILTLPISCLPLANSERTQFQAFKVIGKPIYGIQFDPASLNLRDSFLEFATYPQQLFSSNV